MDEAGNVREAYARKIHDDLRTGTPLHLYLPGLTGACGMWRRCGTRRNHSVRGADRRADVLVRGFRM